MADRNVGSSGSSGISLYWLIGTAVAWFKTASFTGWTGFGKAMLVGSGTATGAGILGFAGGLMGAGIGLVIGLTSGRRRAASVITPTFICGALGAFGGSVVGGIQGYSLSKEWLTVAPRQPAAISAPAAGPQPVTKAMSVQATS